MLDQDAPTGPIGSRVHQQFAHHVQLVKAREHLFLLHLAGLGIALLDDLGEVLDDVGKADRGQHFTPEVISLEAVRVGRVARAIVLQRKTAPYARTTELAETIRANVPRSKDGIDPATRTFQALRIAVNDELGELERGLLAAESLLVPGGRLAVVTFHSLEDRIVKDFLKSRSSSQEQPSRHIPITASSVQSPVFIRLNRKPIGASPSEIARNARSRSAMLRAAIRTNATATARPLIQGSRP